MKRYVLLACLAGCGPAAREQQPPPEETPDAALPDAAGLPAGAWEPDPGLGRSDALLLADGSDVWFVYSRHVAMAGSHIWLTKTTSTGEVLVPPMQVDDGPELAAWPAAIGRSGDNIAIVWNHASGGMPPRLRMFDASGQPLAAGHLVPMADVVGTYMTAVALAGRDDGSMRLFATYDNNDMTTEVAMVDLDATGNPVGDATLFGVADAASPVGLSAVESGGATLVAWDRRYDICQNEYDPDATLVTDVASDGALAPISDVHPSGLGDREPALAALGANAYLAWVTDTAAGSVIRVSRAADPMLGSVDIGNPVFGNGSPMLALADATHGAVAWMTDEVALRVASVRDDGTNLVAGAEHPIPLPPGANRLRGFVHVGGERYLVSWSEDFWWDKARLYSLVVDLSMPPRPAPAGFVPDARAPRRCSH